jgi:hypothetical protein
MNTSTSTENQANTRQKGRWLRPAMLAYTLAGPAIGTWIKRARQDSQKTMASAKTLPEAFQNRQADFRERLEELTRESRQRAVEQAQHLRAQAKEMQAQSRQLRKAVRNEARQQRKLLAQLRDSGIEWSQDTLKRGEHLTGDLVERGSEALHDLAERSGEMTHDLAKRGRKATRDLAKRGRKATRDLAKRSEEMLEPVREQNPMVWTVIGFGVGLAIAGAITYRLVRGRVIKLAEEEDQSIELPQNGVWNGKVARPAGEIRRFGQGGAGVATLQSVGVTNAERPGDAAFVGVLSTKYYYPADTKLEPTDLVYFTSEAEAREKGFQAAD